MTDETIMMKIKALLAMAEHANSNQYEAALAMERAQALLLAHNLTRADIVNDQATSSTPGIGKVENVESNGFKWKSMVLHVIAKSTMCNVVISPREDKWHLFGTRDNVQSVLTMYQWVIPQLEQMAIREWSAYKADGSGRSTSVSWRTSFYAGATSTISERLRKPFQDFSQGNGRSIVVFNERALAEATRKVFPRLSHSSSRTSIGSQDGYSAGKSAGSRVSFGGASHLHSGAMRLGAG